MKKECELLVKIGMARTVPQAKTLFEELAGVLGYVTSAPSIDLSKASKQALSCVVYDDDEEINEEAFLDLSIALGLDSSKIPNELPTPEDEEKINQTLETC